MKLLSAEAIRRCLIADPGFAIITADFSQVELRIAAAYAGESVLIEAAKRGENLMKITAAELFGENYSEDEYRYSKNVTYGWLFGGGPKTLSEQAGISFGQAREIVQHYENTFSAMASYKRRGQMEILKSAFTPQEYKIFMSLRSKMYNYRSDTPEGRKAQAVIKKEIDRLCWRKHGYVTTDFGRRLIVDASKAYTFMNYKVQSTAADILKYALLRVMADRVLEPTVLLPIHDEILGQAPIKRAQWFADRYAEVMTTEFRGVPITAAGKVYGESWGHGYRKV